MNSTKPYLIRAFYEWIVDSDCTPHVVVNADTPNVEVPDKFVEGGQIVLNIAMPAVQDLELENDAISFKARFSGVPHNIYIPMPAVMAIYAKENGRGMVFSEEEDDDTDTPPPEKGGKGSHLKVVK